MKVLILYGTTDGHTRTIASAISSDLERRGHEVTTVDVSEPLPGIVLNGFDLCILAASVRQKQYAEAVMTFAGSNSQILNQMLSAFVSVSLAAAFPEGRSDAESYVKELLCATGWNPVMVHHAAGALHRSSYDYFQEQIVRHVVLKGRGSKIKSGNHEFTDWRGVERFIDTLCVISTEP